MSYAGSPISGSISSSRRRPRGRSAGGGLVALLGGHLPAHDPVGERTEPGGDLVDGRGGDHEEPEEGEQPQQRHHDVGGLEQVHQQLGDDEADRAARLLEGCGVAELGGGRAVGDVHDPEHAEQQRGPADHLATGGAVGLGVAQVAPGDEAQQQRHQPGQQPDRAGDDGPGEVTDAAGELPPHGGGDDQGHADQEQARTVATVRGIELAGGVPDAAYAAADGVGDPQPGRRQHPAERGEEQRDRARPVAHGTGRRAAAGSCPACGQRSTSVDFWAGLRPVLLPDGRERVLEPPCPDFRAEVFLPRDPGGEDVRVAMVCESTPKTSSVPRVTRRTASRVATAARPA